MASRPGFSPGMPPPRPSSSTGHNGSSGPHRGFEAKMISPHDSRSGYVKSSPLSETAESPSERLAHSKLDFLLVCKVEKILKGSLDSIQSPSPSVKMQIMGVKDGLRCKSKTLLGIVNKHLKTKSLLTSPSNVLPYYILQVNFTTNILNFH